MTSALEAEADRRSLARELRSAANRLTELADQLDNDDAGRAFDRLSTLADTTDRLNLNVADLVELARAEKSLTWAEIGIVFGITRQAAHERFDGTHQQRWLSTINGKRP